MPKNTKRTRKTYTNTPKPEAKPYEPYDFASNIIAYENGELDEEETTILFQYLIDTGLAWTFPGRIGRTAWDLIEAGLCTPKGG